MVFDTCEIILNKQKINSGINSALLCLSVLVITQVIYYSAECAGASIISGNT